MHKAYAGLNETPGHQATSAVVRCVLTVEAVELAGGSRLFGNVQNIASAELHARGKLVVEDPRLQLGFSRMPCQVTPIELGEQLEVVASGAFGKLDSGLEVEDGRALRVELRAAIDCWQPTVLPQLRPVRAIAIGVAQHNV